MQQYIARRGDTVSRIAARHGLTPGMSYRESMGWQPAVFISGAGAVPAVCPAQAVCGAGRDDAQSIASLFGVGIDELEMLNPGVSSGRICLPGKVLVIPAATRGQRFICTGNTDRLRWMRMLQDLQTAILVSAAK